MRAIRVKGKSGYQRAVKRDEMIATRVKGQAREEMRAIKLKGK